MAATYCSSNDDYVLTSCSGKVQSSRSTLPIRIVRSNGYYVLDIWC